MAWAKWNQGQHPVTRRRGGGTTCQQQLLYWHPVAWPPQCYSPVQSQQVDSQGHPPDGPTTPWPVTCSSNIFNSKFSFQDSGKLFFLLPIRPIFHRPVLKKKILSFPFSLKVFVLWWPLMWNCRMRIYIINIQCCTESVVCKHFWPLWIGLWLQSLFYKFSEILKYMFSTCLRAKISGDGDKCIIVANWKGSA